MIMQYAFRDYLLYIIDQKIHERTRENCYMNTDQEYSKNKE